MAQELAARKGPMAMMAAEAVASAAEEAVPTLRKSRRRSGDPDTLSSGGPQPPPAAGGGGGGYGSGATPKLPAIKRGAQGGVGHYAVTANAASDREAFLEGGSKVKEFRARRRAAAQAEAAAGAPGGAGLF